MTGQAAEKIKESLRQHSAAGLRIRARKPADGPLAYELELEERHNEREFVGKQRGVELYIDPETADNIRGSTIDYVPTSKGPGFLVKNPNTSCGCGSSGCGCGCSH